MSVVLAFLSTSLGQWIVGVFGVIGAVIVAHFKGKRDGKALERAKQADAERRARTIADEVDNDIGALPSGQAREELRKWAKR